MLGLFVSLRLRFIWHSRTHFHTAVGFALGSFFFFLGFCLIRLTPGWETDWSLRCRLDFLCCRWVNSATTFCDACPQRTELLQFRSSPYKPCIHRTVAVAPAAAPVLSSMRVLLAGLASSQPLSFDKSWQWCA